MEHVAFDLGGRESQVCIRSSDGQVLLESRVPTAHLGKLLQKRPPSRVVIETCAEAFSIADRARELGHEVRVVPAGLVRTLGVGARGMKTDVRDARVLSEGETPSYVERQLCSIDELTVHIVQADKELEALAKTDRTCPRLMSVPGVGPVTAIRFVAALDQIDRFSSVAQVQSYLGLTPGENSSSERTRRTGITKAGPAPLRASLVQAAWAAKRSRGNHPMLAWVAQVEKRRGKHVAIVALARKLSAILFAIWRDGTFYDPKHSKSDPAG